MKAFAVLSPDSPEIVEIDLKEPSPESHEVLVDLTHSGVCHSDVHIRLGGFDLGSAGFLTINALGNSYPIVMGHEMAGIVAAVGDEVTDVAVGDAVVIYPWLGCGSCTACESGNENSCPNVTNALGISQPGGYAERVLVPHDRYVVPLEGLDPAWGAVLTCSGITAYSAASTALPEDPEDPVVVIGAGGVGFMAIATLSALGHRNIVVVDRNDSNFERAIELGARKTGVTSDSTTPEELTNLVGAAPAVIIDFVNSGATASLAYASLRTAGTLVQVGLFGGEVTLPTALTALRQIRMIGKYVGGLDDLHQVIKLARDGKLPKIPLLEAEMSLDAVTEALDGLENGTSRGRTVLTQPAAV